MRKKKVIVFQHIENEGLEKIDKYLDSKNILITTIKFYKNEKIPSNLNQFSLMIVLGGPMDVWMLKKYPWLAEEKKAIKKFVIELNKPFVGICLGCQLLGEVVGGKVVKSKSPEIGFLNIFCKETIKHDKILDFLPESFIVFQWHSYEVDKINNPEIEILAESNSTKIQMFRYGNHAYGLQFHLEINEDSIIRWCNNNNFKKKLEIIYGKNLKQNIKKDFKKVIKNMNMYCKKFITNIIKNFI